MSFKNKVKALQNKKRQEEEENAKVQEMPLAPAACRESAKQESAGSVTDANPTPTEDDGNVAPSVPNAPSVSHQDDGTRPLKPGQVKSFEDAMQVLSETVLKLIGYIPKEDSYYVDLSRESIREALAATLLPIVKDQMSILLRDRRKEIDEGYEAKRKEYEVQGKTLVFEHECMGWVVQWYEETYGYFEKLKNSDEEWHRYVKAFNEHHAEINKDRLNEYKNAKAAYEKLNADLKTYIEQAIDSRKRPIPAPEKPSGDDVGQQFYYLLILLPLYKVRCFLTDRYTLAFFHTAILTVLITLLGLIGFMAQDMARYEREAEKYDIVRLWSYTDDTTPVKDRHRILDGLFEDKKHNMDEISKLIRELNAAYAKKREVESKR